MAGFDVATQAHEALASMGVVGQSATVDELLTCRENLSMICGFFGLSGSRAEARCDELIDRFGLGK